MESHTVIISNTTGCKQNYGQGGFQEVEQMNLFKDMVCYQEEVRDPSRMAEVLNRVIEKAIRGSHQHKLMSQEITGGQVIDIDLPIVRLERQGGGADAISKAADLLSSKISSNFI